MANWAKWPNWNYFQFFIRGPYTKILEPMLDLDTKQCAVWKDEVQNLLILAGLFSAVVTAFVIESYQTLQPNPNDQIIALLSRIADQTDATIGNASTHATSLPAISAFVPSPSSVRINIYWFISLVLSLTVALIGIIAQQWLREHQLYRKDMDPLQQFAVFNARTDGLKRWYVPQIFAGLPLLLQTALVLFFIGLVEFLFSIEIDVAIPVVVAVSIPIIFLVATTILPTLQLCAVRFPYLLRVNDPPPAPCPYKSPQALIFQNVAIASSSLFKLFAGAFSAICIPFVIAIRVFSSGNKPFYGKSVPFSTDDKDYRCSYDRLRKAARQWSTMDIQWLATRTTYAVAMQNPIAVHPEDAYISNTNLPVITGFYDWVTGMKQVANATDPSDRQHREALAQCMANPLEILFSKTEEWAEPIEASRTDPGVGRVLKARFGRLLRVISPYNYQQMENLVELCHGDPGVVHNAFFAVFVDQAWGSELNLYHEFLYIRLVTHMKLTRLYLERNARQNFLCSNLPGIAPSFLRSARLSLARHRTTFLEKNESWMQRVSRLWTETLSRLITDVGEMPPSQPFTGECNGSPTSQCDSNLHTESIVALTEYILLFQVRSDITQTLGLLNKLCTTNHNPVQERPLVLLIACAYINAVANVNQDDVEGFSTLLHTICELCGSQNPTLEARPGGKGRHWPCLGSAFDYIRNHACAQNVVIAEPVPQVSMLPHNIGAADNV